VDLAKFGKVCKLKAFVPFKSAQDALENINSISEGLVTPLLKGFLESNLPSVKKAKKAKFTLGVSDKRYATPCAQTPGWGWMGGPGPPPRAPRCRGTNPLRVPCAVAPRRATPFSCDAKNPWRWGSRSRCVYRCPLPCVRVCVLRSIGQSIKEECEIPCDHTGVVPELVSLLLVPPFKGGASTPSRAAPAERTQSTRSTPSFRRGTCVS